MKARYTALTHYNRARRAGDGQSGHFRSIRSPLLRRALGGAFIATSLACPSSDKGGQHQSADVRAAHIDTIPLRTFGSRSDDYLLGVVGGLIRGDTIVIAERSGRLRLYRRSGELLKEAGGKGQGPGEFVSLAWIQSANERIYAYDADARKLSEFSGDGTFVRSVQIEPRPPFAYTMAVGVFGDQTILVRAEKPRPRAQYDQTIRPSVALLRYTAGGKFLNELTSYEDSEMFAGPYGRGGETLAPLAFGRQSAVAVSGNHYIVLASPDEQITLFDTLGRKVSDFRANVSLARPAITTSAVRAARRRFIANETMEIRLGPVFDRMILPTTLPHYGWAGQRPLAVLKSSTGAGAWVLHYGGLDDSRATRTSLSMDGGTGGQLVSFGEVDILDMSGDLALVHRWDDRDVETIELRRIIR